MEDAGSGTGTYVNGQRLMMKQRVLGPTVLELGVGGPRVEVLFGLVDEGGERRTDAASAGVGKGGGNGLSLLWVALGLAVLGLVGWWLQSQMGRGGNAVAAPSGAVNADSGLVQTVKRYESSVGLVIAAEEGRSSPTGTAWVVRPNVYATNAHVVVPVIRCMQGGGTAYVVSNKNPENRMRVVAAVPHPRYFEDEVSVTGKNPTVPHHDVGLLVVEGTSPEPMKLASEEKLRELDSGHRVAFLGFPMENLSGGGVDPNHPVATMQSGIVTATTDFWLAKAEFANRKLVQHNLPAVGGASGSPIFDAEGDVVAILSAGNITFTLSTNTWLAYAQQIEAAKRRALEDVRAKAQGKSRNEQEAMVAELEAMMQALDRTPVPVMAMQRAPSAALINFGQRIDMLKELLEMWDASRELGR
jgi:hypothetical protein